jgi:hypothetical protein
MTLNEHIQKCLELQAQGHGELMVCVPDEYGDYEAGDPMLCNGVHHSVEQIEPMGRRRVDHDGPYIAL